MFAPLGVSYAVATANCYSGKQLQAALSLWAVTVLQIVVRSLCYLIFSISVAVSIIKVSQVQHVDHKPCERANGPKLLVQLYACRCGLNPIGIKREKEPQVPLLVVGGYG